MPREQITHNIHSTNLTESGAIVAVETPRRNVHVSWNRTGWVQVGIDMTIEEIRGLLEYGLTEARGAAAANAHLGEYATEQHQVRVYSDVIDRAEVNATVRTLRRARDTAYGRDE